MYNLLMKSSSDYSEWEVNQGRFYDVRFLAGRIFEHTAESVKRQFTGIDGADFHALMKLPCLFTYEGHDVIGSIGRISEVRPVGGSLQIAYTLPDIYPKIQMDEDSVFEGLGIVSFEQNRTHWAVKDVDLFEVATRLLHKAGNVPIVLSPGEMNRVWGVGYMRKKLVFLSYRASVSRKVADVKEQLERQGLSCFLAHEDVTPSTIWQDEILTALKTMDVFIGFVTDDFHGGGWPDQEVGYAYQREVSRVFVKLGNSDPLGLVAREQALRTDWEHAGQEIIAHLKRQGVL